MASDFYKELAAERQRLSEALVSRLLPSDIDKEDFDYAAAFVSSNILDDRYPATNELEVIREVQGIVDKLQYHAKPTLARRLWAKVEVLLKRVGPKDPFAHDILRLLLLLSDRPTSLSEPFDELELTDGTLIAEEKPEALDEEQNLSSEENCGSDSTSTWEHSDLSDHEDPPVEDLPVPIESRSQDEGAGHDEQVETSPTFPELSAQLKEMTLEEVTGLSFGFGDERRLWQETLRPASPLSDPSQSLGLCLPCKIFPEVRMVQLLHWLLRGFPAVIFEEDTASQGYRRFKRKEQLGAIAFAGLSPSLCSDVLQRFLELANYLQPCRDFVLSCAGLANEGRGSSTVRAMSGAMSSLVEEFEERLLDLSADGEISVLELLSLLEQDLDTFAALSRVARNAMECHVLTSGDSDEHGCRTQTATLLTSLHRTLAGKGAQETFTGSESLRSPSQRLAAVFSESLACYLQIFEPWIRRGELLDLNGEIFIYNVDPLLTSAGEGRNDSKFGIHQAAIPAFLLDLAPVLYEVGVKAHLLRHVFASGSSDNHTLFTFEGWPDRVMAALGDPTASWPRVLDQQLCQPVLNHYQLVDRALRDSFLLRLQLAAHLRVLRSFFFMADEELLGPLVRFVCVRLNSGDVSWADSFVLNHLLSASLSQTLTSQIYGSICLAERERNRSVDPEHVRQMFDKFSVTVEESGARCPPSDVNIMALLRFEYVVEGPLRMILSEESLRQYNSAMRLLLQVKRVRSLYDQLHLEARKKLVLSPSHRRLLAVVSQILHFLSGLQSFLLNQVLHTAWKRLEAALEAADTVEALKRAHEEYLELILERCFLVPRSKMVLHYLRDMMNLAIKFRQELALYLSQGLRMTEQERSRHLALAQDTADEFMKANRYVIIILTAMARTKAAQYLSEALCQLNFNDYFT